MSAKERRPGGESETAQSSSAADLTLGESLFGGSDSPWRPEDLERLLRLGFHLIPLRGKEPLIKWRRGRRDYVWERPTSAEMQAWAEMGPDGWAVLCGGPSRVVVIDVEPPGLTDAGRQGAGIRTLVNRLPEWCRRRSVSGGVHAFLRVLDGPMPSASGAKLVKRLEADGEETLLAELRTEKHYVGILGPGRGALPADFAPHEVSHDQLQEMVEQLRALSDVQPRSLGRGTDEGERAVGGRSWLDELSPALPCRKVWEQTQAVLKALAMDNLTSSILGPVQQLIRLASYGHQGVPEALEQVREEFLYRVDLRGSRPGGRISAEGQWDRALAGAVRQVRRPRWLDTLETDPRLCECWVDDYLARHQAARPPLTSKGQARTSEVLVVEHLVSWARSRQRRVVRQSQRQISLATTMRLETVNKTIRRLVEQGWLARHDGDEYGIHGLELAVPEAITGTPRSTPGATTGVPVMSRELHWLFSSRGLGRGVAETFRHLPECRIPVRGRRGALIRVTPGITADVFTRPPSSRPLPGPGQGGGRTVAELASITGKTPATVRRHLKELTQVGLAFEGQNGRWFRYLTHPDWIAERERISDLTPERRRLYEHHRRRLFERLAAREKLIRAEDDTTDTYVDPVTGQVRWVDRDPPRRITAPRDANPTLDQGDSPS